MIVLDEHNMVEIVEDLCPYCDRPLTGPVIQGLHEQCWEEVSEYE